MQDNNQPWVIYGSELSPFTLKLMLMCQHAGLAFRLLPTDAGLVDNLAIQLRLKKLLKGKLPLTWPQMSEEDEFPLVPFLFGPNGQNLYDSTAIAHWLDQRQTTEKKALIPKEPAAAFVAQLIDDYADEFGLYMVHHYRWKVAARDNNAGQRLAHEWRSLLGPLQRPFGAWFSARQVKRLPYLFSIAPDKQNSSGLAKRRIPPQRAGFPATDALLEAAFERLLDSLEGILSQQPFLLGGRFTLADASLYGQLAMNLDDPSAAAIIEKRAIHVFNWLQQLRQGSFPKGDGKLVLSQRLTALLNEISRIHIPLMQQNLAAYIGWKATGADLFNEAAFDKHQALYNGTLDNQAFRHVAKSFQAKSWLACRQRWQNLDATAKTEIQQLSPALETLNSDQLPVHLINA